VIFIKKNLKLFTSLLKDVEINFSKKFSFLYFFLRKK